MDFRFRLSEGDLTYTGRELRSGFVQSMTGLSGDAGVVFFGQCAVPTEHLVDLDDWRAGATIVAARMAHVIVEHPDCELGMAVLRQRLLVYLLSEILTDRAPPLRRDGDDLYCDGRKLTVSIAAPSSKSSVIHLGVNLDPTGAPVPAIGLVELGMDGVKVMGKLMSEYAEEFGSIAHAASKVRPVP